MKKITGIIALSFVFYFNPITIKNSNSFLSNPLDKCMTRVINGTYGGDESVAAGAAKLCAGADNTTDKCMARVIKGTYGGDESVAAGAAKLCLGN